MTERKLIVSFGNGLPLPGNEQLAIITAVSEDTWDAFGKLLTTTPPESEDKSSRGWFCPAEFSQRRRHGNNFVARHALTFDYDVIAPADLKVIQSALNDYAYAIYTTWSHTAEKPRIRVVMPLSRSVDFIEFGAVSRKIAAAAGIELAARESHVHAQCTFQPTRKPGAKFFGRVNTGKWINVDEVLASYADWTDKTSWPSRAVGDTQHNTDEEWISALDKPGIIGLFNRTFSISQAIERFELPFAKVR